MKHFYESIDGFMTDRNLALFDLVISKSYDNFKWIELGSWTGKSVAYCVVELVNKNIDFEFYSVDTWKGAEEHQDYDIVKEDRLYDIFLENINPIKQYVTPMRTMSFEAAKDFKDNSVDFCYVDADHSYEGVSKDLEAWWPKIKPGCYFGGDDYTKGWPSVQHAVNDFFKSKNIRVRKLGRCWYVQK